MSVRTLANLQMDPKASYEDENLCVLVNTGKNHTWKRVMKTGSKFLITKTGENISPDEVLRVRLGYREDGVKKHALIDILEDTDDKTAGDVHAEFAATMVW